MKKPDWSIFAVVPQPTLQAPFPKRGHHLHDPWGCVVGSLWCGAAQGCALPALCPLVVWRTDGRPPPPPPQPQRSGTAQNPLCLQWNMLGEGVPRPRVGRWGTSDPPHHVYTRRGVFNAGIPLGIHRWKVTGVGDPFRSKCRAIDEESIILRQCCPPPFPRCGAEQHRRSNTYHFAYNTKSHASSLLVAQISASFAVRSPRGVHLSALGVPHVALKYTNRLWSFDEINDLQ